jgi:F-type H+-transporting ATPase subunit b
MEIIKEFGINPILLLAQIVNFAILLFLLNKFLYKPILKVLDDRKVKVSTSIKNAEEIEKRLEQIQKEQENILEKARLEAASIVIEAKSEAKELTEQNLAETKSTMNELLEKNKERMLLEKEKLMKDAKKELADIVFIATKAVAKKEVTKESNTKLIEETIRNLDREK